jgi:hypothetical protein
VLRRFISRQPDQHEILRFSVALFQPIESVFELSIRDLDPTQYAEADRREVDPPIEVESATWSTGGTLDWWVKERREWFGRARRPNGRQKWIKADDLRRAKEE